MECDDDYGMEWEPSNQHDDYNDEDECFIDT